MRKMVMSALSLSLLLGSYLLINGGNVSNAGKVDEQEKKGGKAGTREIVHMVFVELKENTKEERDKMVTLCHKYLPKHPGEVYFRCGPKSGVQGLKTEQHEPFDVGWVNVFTNGEELKKYQESDKLNEFRKLTEPHIKHMKVFDLSADPF